MLPLLKRISILLVLPLLCSCGEEVDPNRKTTFPVTGQLIIDGQPAPERVAVSVHNVAGIDSENPTVSRAFTDKEGKFSLSTYESGDGVPAGDYVLTVMWGQLNTFSASYGGPDKLKGRYDNPKTSPIKFTVKEGEPTDLGNVELTTK